MTSQHRIRIARRHAGLSQSELAKAVGVQRSAVSHWEAARSKHPRVAHLREVALITGVQFEWLATGRGEMAVSKEAQMSTIATAEALLVDEPLEIRLVLAFRDAPSRSHLSLVEVVEQLAVQRTGRGRSRTEKPND